MPERGVCDATPEQAWEILRDKPEAVLLDVRTRMEYEYVGHPPGAVHVPWQEIPDWKVRPEFVSEVREALRATGSAAPEQIPVLAMCRSGKRSLAAAEELARQGFREVYNIVEGFEGDRDPDGHRSSVNGWRYRGLPWEQS